MELQNIIQHLTKKHYNKKISFCLFDPNGSKTDTVVKRTISDLFTVQEWESGISLLHRLQMVEKTVVCFNDFWGNFLVNTREDRQLWMKSVEINTINVEEYLKHLLELLGYNEEVNQIKKNKKGMFEVIRVANSKGLFCGEGDAFHIAHTLRCLRNWWVHGYNKTPEDEKDDSGNAGTSTMLIPDFVYDEDDFPLLNEHVRTILVLLLFITRSFHDQIESRLAPISSKVNEEEQFNQSQFLDLYFSNLQKYIDKELNAQTIKELKTDNDFGYFEHTLRFSHSTEEDLDSLYDEEEGNGTLCRLKLSQFRKGTSFKTNVILGMPGAGKTTALYMLMHEYIRQYNSKSDEAEKDSACVPIFIPLRSVVSRQNEDTIKGAINQEIGHRILEKDLKYREAAFRFIYEKIMEGRVHLFFDGLNEMSPEEVKPIIADLKNFIENLPDDSRIFVTGRRYEYESSFYSKEIKKVSSVGIWHLEELSFEQIENYLTPQVRLQIINGGIVELFSSPLNLRLFLNYINRRQNQSEDGSLEMPLNRGEILDAFLHDTLNDIKNSKTGKSYLYHANQLLKKMATSHSGRQWDTDLFENCIDNQPEGLLYRLAAANILSITPARADEDEQVSFSIDTFQEFYRAKHIIDRLYEDKGLSLYSLKDDSCTLDPESSEDFETLKLVFEIGSSPLCYSRSFGKTPDESQKKVASFSARLAKDFLNPEKAHMEINPSEELCTDVEYRPYMNPRFLTLCRLTRNIAFTEDKDIDEKTIINAKDIAELLAINKLRWFRIKHPQPMVISKKLPFHTFLIDLMTASAIIGGSNIWNEIISTYWLFSFGILSPHDYNLNDEHYDKDKKPIDKVKSRLNSAYMVLHALAHNCRDYIYVYDKIHNLHRYQIKRKRICSCFGLNTFLYQHLLYFQPVYAKKHLYHHLTEMHAQNNKDWQMLADINTILCYCGDNQMLVENFRFDSNSDIRIKELRYILSNFADVHIQKFVLSQKFFKKILPNYKGEDLRAMTIRHFLFRIGMTPTMKDFLFKEGGLKIIPQEDVEGIMDMIPLHSIPKEFIEMNYDSEICNLLIKERDEDTEGCRVDYVYFGKKDENSLITINDIQEECLTGETCHIGSERFNIVNDGYKDTVRLYCWIKATDEQSKLLPETGIIYTEDNSYQIPYRSHSPNVELDFFLYAEDATNILAISKEGKKTYIDGTECMVSFPEMKKQPSYRPFRVIEISPCEDNATLPYSGEMIFSRQIDLTARPRAAYNCPERYKHLSNNLEFKAEKLNYRVFGQNRSFLWVITEKVITSADLLTGHAAVDGATNERYQIHSVKPHNTQYMEFCFKTAQRIALAPYGTFSLMDEKDRYSHIPFCFCIMSEDGFSFKLRVSYEDIPDYSEAELQRASYLIGNIPLQLVSAERINPNRRYSVWTLKKNGKNCLSSSGELFVQVTDESGKKKQVLTVSGETRTTIKQISCELASYDRISEEVTFVARRPKGIIGPGNGDYNLLKGLFMSSPQVSSVRFQIEKNSEMAPLWVKRMHIRFNMTPSHHKGHLMVNDSKICFVRQDKDYVLWCNCNSNVTDSHDLEELLTPGRDIELRFDDGSCNNFRIMEVSSGEKVSDNSMIIHSHCRKEFSELLKNSRFEFNLQNFMPVLNEPEFPKKFKSLYPVYSIRYTRDIQEEGAIIIPKPLIAIEADSVTLDGGLTWNIKHINELGNKLLQIGLVDRDGRTPKLMNTSGTVIFHINNRNTPLWYGNLTTLIDRNHPEKYHAEVCDKLLDEILGGEQDLDMSTLNFFISKSRLGDLATDTKLLKDIDDLPESRLEICRVLQSDPLKGMESYSLLRCKNIPSGDTMPESHKGREFQWGDLVLMEKNHKLTLANDLPRYRCMGYKDGFILTIAEPDKKGRQMMTIISLDNEEKIYTYFFDPNKDTRAFSTGDYVNFLATVNYKDVKKAAAERVVLNGRRRHIHEAVYTGCRSEVNHMAYSFKINNENIEIWLNMKATQKIDKYNSLLTVGQSYRIIKGSRKYYLAE